MDVKIKCPVCKQRISTNAVPGQEIPCPTCEHMIQVPVVTAGGRAVALPSARQEGAAAMGTLALLSAPWAVSVIFHVIVLLFMATFVFVKVIRFEEEDFLIPDAVLGKKPGGAASVRPAEKAVRKVTHVKARQYSPDKAKELMDSITGKAFDELAIIGTGAGGGSLAAMSDLTGGGPQFFGSGAGGNVYRICYVVDRSGSMAETFDFVREELKGSIRRLKKQQYFHVIFFSTGPPLENKPRKLVPATLENKRAVYAFLETVVPEEGTEPAGAMRRAFEVRNEEGKGAQLIYFLTDGEFDRSLLDQLEVWNRKRKVKINTISFVFKAGEPLLREIAQRHGGRYKHVSRYELGLQER